MILLDTNVVSETMRPRPAPVLVAWLARQVHSEMSLSAPTVTEVTYGMLVLPDGKRKEALRTAIGGLLETIGPRILPFDKAAALRHAVLAAEARRTGRGFPVPASYIAAIAAVHGLAVATRDAAPFVAAGLTVIDPFTAG